MTQLVHVVAKLGVADCLVDAPQTAIELAERVNANPDGLHRVMRALASVGLFSQDASGRFGLTDEGQRLRSNAPRSMRLPAITYGEPWWWQAWGGLSDTVQTGKTAFQAIHGIDLFAFLSSHADAAALFNGIMDVMTSEQALAVAEGYDFATTETLLDIGGGHGALATAILRLNPKIKAILFDQPSVIEGARTKLSTLDIRDRCSLVGGDFFVSVPNGADTVLLKDIIHDWNDDAAMKILRNVRKAMVPTSKLLLVERVVPPLDAPSSAKLVDITMLVLTGGRERTEQEYRSLLKAAGFNVSSILPVGGDISVIDARPSTDFLSQ